MTKFILGSFSFGRKRSRHRLWARGVDKSFLAAKRENSIFKHCSWAVRWFLFGFPLRSFEVCLTEIVWLMRSQCECVMACMWHVTVNCYGFCQFKFSRLPAPRLKKKKRNAFEINFWNCFGSSCVSAMYLSEMRQSFHLNGNYNLIGIEIKEIFREKLVYIFV